AAGSAARRCRSSIGGSTGSSASRRARRANARKKISAWPSARRGAAGVVGTMSERGPGGGGPGGGLPERRGRAPCAGRRRAPKVERDGVDAPLDARAQESFARADLPDVSVVEDDAAPTRPAPDARPKRPA